MGDKKRFARFAALVHEYLPLDARIADVAGGKGHLQAALRGLGYRHVTSWDKRRKYLGGRINYRWGWFSWAEKTRYDAVVALHPDQGTDHALLYAVRNQVPALVVPCCILPSAENYWGQNKYPAWLEHLQKLVTDRGGNVVVKELDIIGRNDVLVVAPVTGGKP